MRSVPVVEAKAKFSFLLSQIEGGEEIALTRHGKVVAMLVPTRNQMAAETFLTLWNESTDMVEPEDSEADSIPDLDVSL